MRSTIRAILENPPLDREIEVKGWVKSIRRSKKFSFIVLWDASSMESLQLFSDNTLFDHTLSTGCALLAKGILVASPGKGQKVELQTSSLEILGPCGEDYPIQKKSLSLEFLREKAHLRMRTDLFRAVFRLRHHVTLAIHEFFNEREFFHLHSPILTGLDAEGAGEQFSVTNLNLSKTPLNFQDDYFGTPASLCVTGQLEAECMALGGLERVYTFGPTFRAENSNTPYHLAEFWMIEPEAAFFDLEDIILLAQDFLKHLISSALEKCPREMEFLSTREGAPKNHLESLEGAMGKMETITYDRALEILKTSPHPFKSPPTWGNPLQREHEQFLATTYARGPLAVVDYPKDTKAFYMRQNDDGKTVGAMDILVPGVGELMGGSQREERLHQLEKRMEEKGMDRNALWWYLDLRRFASIPHSGFGLGLERALMYMTGLKNIRDVIPFPRVPGNCEF